MSKSCFRPVPSSKNQALCQGCGQAISSHAFVGSAVCPNPMIDLQENNFCICGEALVAHIDCKWPVIWSTSEESRRGFWQNGEPKDHVKNDEVQQRMASMQSPWPRALTQKEIDEYPLDGWCNVYRNAYGIIWANEDSARGAVGAEADCPHMGGVGDHLRTVRVVEVRPGSAIYSQRQVDLLLANEHAKANRKAGKGLMEMLNGMGDMRRDGRDPTTSQVITAMEQTIAGLRAANEAKDRELLAERAHVVKLRDELDQFRDKLASIAKTMGIEI